MHLLRAVERVDLERVGFLESFTSFLFEAAPIAPTLSTPSCRVLLLGRRARLGLSPNSTL